MPPETQRKVYFFRVFTDIDEDGTATPYDPDPALAHINALPFDEGGRYLATGDGELNCCWIDRAHRPQRIRLGKVRRTNLPSLEERGNLEPLDLDEETGLVEQVHMVFFDRSILGVLYNFYGPRASSLSRYLVTKHADTPQTLQIEPLLRQDVIQQLDRLERIRVLRLKILRPFIARLEQADQSLHATFRAAMEAGEAEEFELVLKPAPYQREWIGQRLLTGVRRIAAIVANDTEAREEMGKFEVRGFNGETGGLETVDVLHDQLVSEKTVVRYDERSRAIRSDSAYAAIEEAYAELREDLELAAAVFQ